MEDSKLLSEIEEVFNKYSFKELTKNYEDIISTYISVRYSKYNEETRNNANYGVEYLEDLYNKDKDFKELIKGITECAIYQVKVIEFEREQQINVGSWDDIFQCGPHCKVGVLEKFQDIVQEKALSNAFSEWWVNKFASEGFLKEKNVYRVYLVKTSGGNKIEYSVFVDFNEGDDIEDE